MDPHPLEQLLQQRIVLLDGAMGTMIQRFKLAEEDYRGERFRDWKGNDLKGSLELLQLTRPPVIEQIHLEYLKAGADIIETNTFSGTTIGLHDFLFPGSPTGPRKDQEFFDRVTNDPDLRSLVHEINLSAAQIARRAADRVANETGTPRFVAGSMGPLPVTGSLSPDVNDPGFRAVNFDQLKKTYADQVEALLAGGVDLLAVETVFDTLNAKAALFAITEIFERTGKSVPLLVSGTVTDRSGRMLSGQTVEAFLTAIAHARPLIVGLNCALGPDEMEPYIEELSRLAPTYLAAYPNAGLPDPLSETGFPETPRKPRAEAREMDRQRLAQRRGRLLRHHARAHPRSSLYHGDQSAASTAATSLLLQSELRSSNRQSKFEIRKSSAFPGSSLSTSHLSSALLSSANEPTSRARQNFRS